MNKKIRSDKLNSDKILKNLKKLCIDIGRKPTYKEIDVCNYLPSTKCYERHFGSVDNAIKICCPNLHIQRKRYSKNLLQKEVIRIASILNKTPTQDEFNKFSLMTTQSIKDRYGWNNFLKMCKLIPRKNSYTKKELINILKGNRKELGRNLITEDFKNAPHSSLFYTHFGSWNNALRECGFEIKHPTHISNDGHKCYSVMELYVDNFLFHNKINHEKDVKYPYHKLLNKNNRKTCDWILDNNIYVELFGLMRKNNYREHVKVKKQLCNELGLKLIELYPKDLNNLKENLHSLITLLRGM